MNILDPIQPSCKLFHVVNKIYIWDSYIFRFHPNWSQQAWEVVACKDSRWPTVNGINFDISIFGNFSNQAHMCNMEKYHPCKTTKSNATSTTDTDSVISLVTLSESNIQMLLTRLMQAMNMQNNKNTTHEEPTRGQNSSSQKWSINNPGAKPHANPGAASKMYKWGWRRHNKTLQLIYKVPQGHPHKNRQNPETIQNQEMINMAPTNSQQPVVPATTMTAQRISQNIEPTQRNNKES